MSGSIDFKRRPKPCKSYECIRCPIQHAVVRLVPDKANEPRSYIQCLCLDVLPCMQVLVGVDGGVENQPRASPKRMHVAGVQCIVIRTKGFRTMLRPLSYLILLFLESS